MTAYRSFAAQTLHYFGRSHVSVPQGPVASPADWRGRDFRAHEEEWLERLTQDEIDEVGATVDRLVSKGVAIADVTRDMFDIPKLGGRIARWRNEIDRGRGFVVARGLPVTAWGDEKAAYAYWGIGHHLGTPGAQNPQSELLGHVVDYGEEKANPMVRRYRTTGNIDFHCDAADAVGLLCLHTAKSGGQSRIVSSVAIFNEVSRRHSELVARLFQPFLLDRRGEQREGEPGYVTVQPCCFGEDGRLRTFYHSEYFRSAERFPEAEIDADARALLDLYDELCLSPDFQLDMWLEPGDMQFISNHVTLHSRTAYEDWPERERKRHLLRLWISF